MKNTYKEKLEMIFPGKKISQADAVNFALRVSQVSQAEIGRRYGKTRGWISQIVSGSEMNPEINGAISDVCGIPVEELFFESFPKTPKEAPYDQNPV